MGKINLRNSSHEAACQPTRLTPADPAAMVSSPSNESSRAVPPRRRSTRVPRRRGRGMRVGVGGGTSIRRQRSTRSTCRRVGGTARRRRKGREISAAVMFVATAAARRIAERSEVWRATRVATARASRNASLSSSLSIALSNPASTRSVSVAERPQKAAAFAAHLVPLFDLLRWGAYKEM